MIKSEGEAKVVAVGPGVFATRMILKKRMNTVEERLLDGMDALEKWMFFRFRPYQTTTLPKWMFSQKRLLINIILASKWPNASKWLVPLEPSLKWDSYFIYL